jgi:16S rRNA (guanine966-N2)-methyltransferase
MTRIIAGTRGGRRIAAPPGRDTRPTSDRVREALFSALGGRIEKAHVLDLYAGSGALGLEAASRGASHVLLVESDPRAARAIRANVAALGLGEACHLVEARVEQALARGPGAHRYQVVLADPPYAAGEEEVSRMLAALVDGGWLAPEASVVIERSSRSPEPAWVDGVTGERGRRYGESTLWYGRAS